MIGYIIGFCVGVCFGAFIMAACTLAGYSDRAKNFKKAEDIENEMF
ncbi:MAG: hypothetical protein LUD03_04750 [Firmicutes bacterium]|nr:hypothetical protein [Bacillota bacterium]